MQASKKDRSKIIFNEPIMPDYRKDQIILRSVFGINKSIQLDKRSRGFYQTYSHGGNKFDKERSVIGHVALKRARWMDTRNVITNN